MFPIVYLVEIGAHPKTWSTPKPKGLPALLISYFYVQNFYKNRVKGSGYNYRCWSLDSGGFTADSQGVKIDLQQYIEFCQEAMATEPKLIEIFVLDVITDWRASRRNTEKMWEAGVPAIPVYHAGEPWDVLLGYAKDYPKISLGGMVPLQSPKRKLAFAHQVFARVWPKPIHALGIGASQVLHYVPFHTSDMSTWSQALRFGMWNAFEGANLRARGDLDLTAEINHFLTLERELQGRWTNEMARFDHNKLVLPLARETFKKELATYDIKQRLNTTGTTTASAPTTEDGGHRRRRKRGALVTDSTRAGR